MTSTLLFLHEAADMTIEFRYYPFYTDKNARMPNRPWGLLSGCDGHCETWRRSSTLKQVHLRSIYYSYSALVFGHQGLCDAVDGINLENLSRPISRNTVNATVFSKNTSHPPASTIAEILINGSQGVDWYIYPSDKQYKECHTVHATVCSSGRNTVEPHHSKFPLTSLPARVVRR